jgi:hypothetical protein
MISVVVRDLFDADLDLDPDPTLSFTQVGKIRKLFGKYQSILYYLSRKHKRCHTFKYLDCTSKFYGKNHSLALQLVEQGSGLAGPGCQSCSGSGERITIRPDPDPRHC